MENENCLLLCEKELKRLVVKLHKKLHRYQYYTIIPIDEDGLKECVENY